MRLAGLLGLSSGDETDRVRALVAKAALDRGDGAAACDILSAAILRRPPRLSGGAGREQQQGGADAAADAAALPFAPELCEALDLVVEWGSGSASGRGHGSGGAGTGTRTADAPARTADLCAQALSRCPASQIGRLLGPWSRFEAVRYLAGTTVGGGGGGGGGVSAAGGGGGGTAAVSSVLVEGGMDEHAATSLGRALALDGVGGREGDEAGHSSWLDRQLTGDAGGEEAFGARGGGVPGRAAEGALRFLLLREHGMSSSSATAPILGVAAEAEDQEIAVPRPQGHAEPAARAAGARAAAGEVLQKATNRLCILLALAELRSSETNTPAAVNQVPSADDHGGGGDAVFRPEGHTGATSAEYTAPGDAKKCQQGGGGGGGQEGTGAAAADVSAAMLTGLAKGAAEEFGVGAVERGVGYALAASDGRAVLGALRTLLEEAEGRVKALRGAAVEQGRAGGTSPAGGRPAGGDDEVRENGHGACVGVRCVCVVFLQSGGVCGRSSRTRECQVGNTKQGGRQVWSTCALVCYAAGQAKGVRMCVLVVAPVAHAFISSPHLLRLVFCSAPISRE